MTIDEAKTVFLNRGYVEVEGGTIYDADKWREACVVISEWLEQEPCEDAISKQTVLDTISELNAISFYEAQEDSKECYYEIRQAIKDLPPVKQEPKWIPVSERLPEIDEPVLIFQRYYSGVNITIGRYHSAEEQGGYRYWQWIKYDNDFRYGIEHFGIICPDSYYVDAWMPLPKPYEPQEMSEKPTGSKPEISSYYGLKSYVRERSE